MIEELETQGWVYRDLPKMMPEYFDQLVGIIGEENIKWLTFAIYEGWGENGEDLKRGQLMISPAGIENVKQYNASKNTGPST